MRDLLDNIISSAILTQHVYSKTRFDNARDTKELITAASLNAESLQEAIMYKLRSRQEELVIDRLEELLDGKNEAYVRIGQKLYKIGVLTSKGETK